jgi:hypothetical protein
MDHAKVLLMRSTSRFLVGITALISTLSAATAVAQEHTPSQQPQAPWGPQTPSQQQRVPWRQQPLSQQQRAPSRPPSIVVSPSDLRAQVGQSVTTPQRSQPRNVRGRGEQIVLESLGGIGLGFAAGLAGMGIGFAVSPYSDFSLYPVVGTGVGFILGVPLGVVLAGNQRYRSGNFGASLVGTVGGVLLSGALIAAARGKMNWGLAVAAYMLPVAGAVIGYEVTCENSPEQEAPRSVASFRWSPSLSFGDNGAIIGASGTF